jgi:hypothetical protein
VAGLLPRAIDFQIAHDDVRPSMDAKVDERIGYEHAYGVKHVRVAFAVSDDQ